MKIVICGDIHGDNFWKAGAEYIKNNPEAKMICLGDYLDPYTRYEGIDQDQAYLNFVELLEFAKEYKDQVILLRGNHDYFYLDTRFECCRHDYMNYTAIAKLFEDNKDLFKIAHLIDKYLFTHAGVCEGWINANDLQDLTVEELVDYINTDPKSLWQVSIARGGRRYHGSPLWCCWEGEWIYENTVNPYPITQIFGHTRQYKSNYPLFNEDKNIYMFDVRNSFLLDTKTGEINLLS
jgi:predicted phosphodiesterase